MKRFDSLETPFSKLLALPKDAKPVTTWDEQDEAFLNIVENLQKVIDSMQR